MYETSSFLFLYVHVRMDETDSDFKYMTNGITYRTLPSNANIKCYL